MTDLVLVRHAQSLWNAEGRWQGWADPPLSALGEQQAAGAGQALGRRCAGSPAPVIAASDLRRAHQTAELLAGNLRAANLRAADRTAADRTGAGRTGAGRTGADTILVDPDLREYDTGDWTGLRRSEIAERWPEQLADWDAGRIDATPGGEPRAAFVARLFAALERIHLAVPAGPVLAVSHGRAIHAIAGALGDAGGHVGHLAGWRLHLGPAPVLLGAVSLLEPSSKAEGPTDI